MPRSHLAARLAILFVIVLFCDFASAQLPAEQPGVASLPPPTESWFLAGMWKTGRYVIDAEDGQVKGLVPHYMFTPALVTVPGRGEIYHVDSFMTRRDRGERDDVLVIVDLATLTPKAEVDIPDKSAALPHRGHIGLMGDERLLVLYNLTPAQSVSVVDVIERRFVGEISTPGCAIILPVEQRSFLMICADGALQRIDLDEQGREARRDRSQPFFDPDRDPVFAHTILTRDGWLLVSHNGLAWRVAAGKDGVSVGEPIDLLSENDRAQDWRPGGQQPFSVHRESNRLYVLMHQGGVDTHAEPGSEVWVYDLGDMSRQRRVLLEAGGTNLLVSQQAEPRLYLGGTDSALRIYDAGSLSLLRIIDDLPRGLNMLQSLSPVD